MIYSAFNPVTKTYDYYESATRLEDVDPPTPTHVRASSSLGTPVDLAGWSVPPGARQVGRGPKARGMIGYERSALEGLLDVTKKYPSWLVWAVSGALAYHLARKILL